MARPSSRTCHVCRSWFCLRKNYDCIVAIAVVTIAPAPQTPAPPAIKEGLISQKLISQKVISQKVIVEVPMKMTTRSSLTAAARLR